MDPLPPEIENASEEVKAAYRERMGQESLRQKRLVGRQRYEQRAAYKQALGENMRREAQLRQEKIRQQMRREPLNLVTDKPGGATNFQLIAATACLAVLGWLAKRLFARQRPENLVNDEDIIALGAILGEQEPGKEHPPVKDDVLLASAGNDPEFLRQLVDLYLDQTMFRIAQIRTAIGTSSGAEVKRIARDCAGSSAQCGMIPIAWLFRDLVILGGEHQLGMAVEKCTQVEVEFDRIREHLQNLPQLAALAEPAAPAQAA